MFLNMAKVLFVVRKSKAKTGRYILYCRVSANGKTREFSTEETVQHLKYWCQASQRYTEPGRASEYLNTLIDKLRYAIKTAYMQAGSEALHPATIISQVKGKPKPAPTVTQVIQAFIEFEENENTLHPATLKHHKRYLHNWLQYPAHTMFVTEFTLPVAEDFKRFLRTRPINPCKAKTRASRHVEFFKRAFDYAAKVGTITGHQLTHYKQERDRVKAVVYLTSDEVQRWLNVQLQTKALQQAKDLFVYQMYTGVSYCDIWSKYTVRNIVGVGRIIEGNRNKGRHNAFVLPYSPIAEGILSKYNGTLPYFDNSTYNKLVKIIAHDILGISKNITPHVGRKTFAMRMEADGWPREVIMLMLGHSSLKTTETYYLNNTPARLINEMAMRLAK